MQTTRCVTVPLENKPGTLARVARLVADAKINIEAIDSEVLGEWGYVRVYTTDPDKTTQALKKGGFTPTTTELLEIVLPNKPGELARVTEALAKANVNIESCFGSAGNSPTEGRIYLKVNDVARARTVLESATGITATR